MKMIRVGDSWRSVYLPMECLPFLEAVKTGSVSYIDGNAVFYFNDEELSVAIVETSEFPTGDPKEKQDDPEPVAADAVDATDVYVKDYLAKEPVPQPSKIFESQNDTRPVNADKLPDLQELVNEYRDPKESSND